MKKYFSKKNKLNILWCIIQFFICILVAISFFILGGKILKLEKMGELIFFLFISLLSYSLFLVSSIALEQANEKDFHARASKKIKGAKTVVKLIKNKKQINEIQIHLMVNFLFVYCNIILLKLIYILENIIGKNFAILVGIVLVYLMFILNKGIIIISKKYGSNILESVGKIIS